MTKKKPVLAKKMPLVFLGSSSEGKEVASKVTEQFKDVARVHPWWVATSFKPTSSTIDGLIGATKKYDFGFFILTPDDVMTSRGATKFSARDNVLFEFGLFLGALGDKRTMAIIAAKGNGNLKIPSDLLGVHINGFNYVDEDSLIAGIASNIDPYIKMIKENGRKPPFTLYGSWNFDTEKHEFRYAIDPLVIQGNIDKIGTEKMVLVARKHDPHIETKTDTKITKGPMRSIGKEERAVTLVAGTPGFFGTLEKGDKIDGFVFLIPEKCDISKCETILAIEDLGGMLLGGCPVGWTR
jgi:Predicted nucleotide-binding protein containing TIR-like domain